MARRLSEVVAHWYQLYVLCFGTEASLSEPEFHQLFPAVVRRATGHLREGNLIEYATDVARLGSTLAESGVPHTEVAASAHLYWRSVVDTFTRDCPGGLSFALCAALDKLNHARMMLLADAYIRFGSANTRARMDGLEREAAGLPGQARMHFRGLVGASAPMRALYARIVAAAATRGTVLIVGESGTGKELVARAIHSDAEGHAAPFIPLNCAAIPRDLIESELFGHVKGAFSGALSDKSGLFRAAHGGTLFLDEVTEMSPDTQSKLLRALQEKSVRPVGATREITVDVRVIASTNRDPREAMRTGALREDLYYRLQACVLRIAPLRERVEDIPVLMEHFARLFNEHQKRLPMFRGIEPDALEAIKRHSWPGNVRELSNAIEGALTFGNSGMIRLEDLPPTLDGGQSSLIEHAAEPAPRNAAPPIVSIAEMERSLMRRALERTGGNKARAAEILGISRKRIYTLMREHGRV
ncbi:MAG: sigma-54 dependent transcriptional regulator [Candidatus Binataceae bacterium]